MEGPVAKSPRTLGRSLSLCHSSPGLPLETVSTFATKEISAEQTGASSSSVSSRKLTSLDLTTTTPIVSAPILLSRRDLAQRTTEDKGEGSSSEGNSVAKRADVGEKRAEKERPRKKNSEGSNLDVSEALKERKRRREERERKKKEHAEREDAERDKEGEEIADEVSSHRGKGQLGLGLGVEKAVHKEPNEKGEGVIFTERINRPKTHFAGDAYVSASPASLQVSTHRNRKASPIKTESEGGDHRALDKRITIRMDSGTEVKHRRIPSAGACTNQSISPSTTFSAKPLPVQEKGSITLTVSSSSSSTHSLPALSVSQSTPPTLASSTRSPSSSPRTLSTSSSSSAGAKSSIKLVLDPPQDDDKKKNKVFKERDEEGFTKMISSIMHKKGRRKSIGIEANQPYYQDLVQTLSCGTKSDIIRALKKDPKVVTRSIDEAGDFPIHIAADAGNSEIVLTLIKSYRSPIDAANFIGLTPLHLALRGGKLEAALILVENGANVTTRTPSKATPLHLLASVQCDDPIMFYKLASLMVSRGSQIDEPDSEGNTVIHWAAKCDNCQALLFFSNMKGSIDSLNRSHQSPLTLALTQSCFQAAVLLINLSANIENIEALFPSLPAEVAAALKKRKKDLHLVEEDANGVLEKSHFLHTIARGTLQRLKVQVDEALGELGTLSSDPKAKTSVRLKKRVKVGYEGAGGGEQRMRTPSIDGGSQSTALGVEKLAIALSVAPSSLGLSHDSFENLPAASVRRSSFQSADPYATLTARTLPALKAGVSNPVTARVNSPPQLAHSTSPPSLSTPAFPTPGGTAGPSGGGGGVEERRGSGGVGFGIGGSAIGGRRSIKMEATVLEVAPFAISMDLFGTDRDAGDSVSSLSFVKPAFHNLRPQSVMKLNQKMTEGGEDRSFQYLFSFLQSIGWPISEREMTWLLSLVDCPADEEEFLDVLSKALDILGDGRVNEEMDVTGGQLTLTNSNPVLSLSPHAIFSLPAEADVEVAIFQRMWIRAKGKRTTSRAALYQEMFGDPNFECNISQFTQSNSPAFFMPSSQMSLSTAMGFFSQESLQYADLYRSLSHIGTFISSLSPSLPAHKRLGHLVHLQQLRFLLSDACAYLDEEMKDLMIGIKSDLGGSDSEGEVEEDESSDESYDESEGDESE